MSACAAPGCVSLQLCSSLVCSQEKEVTGVLPPLKPTAAQAACSKRPSPSPSPAAVVELQPATEPPAGDAAAAGHAPAAAAASLPGLTRAQRRQQEAWGSLAGGRGSMHCGGACRCKCHETFCSAAAECALPQGWAWRTCCAKCTTARNLDSRSRWTLEGRRWPNEVGDLAQLSCYIALPRREGSRGWLMFSTWLSVPQRTAR